MADFTDLFDRTDSTDLGANWTELTGDVQIFGNLVNNLTASAQTIAHWTADASTANMYAEANVVKLGSGTTGFGVILRKDGTATQDFYYFELLFDVATVAQNVAALYKCVGGDFGTAVDSGAVTLNTNTAYLLRAEATGTSTTTLRLLVDDVEIISYDDSSSPLTTGKRAGIRGFGSSAGFCNWLDFAWGDFGATTRLLQESGDALLLETGDALLLEDITAPGGGGGGTATTMFMTYQRMAK